MILFTKKHTGNVPQAVTEAVFRRVSVVRKQDMSPMCVITDGMPEAGGGGESSAAPEVASDDDGDGGDSDGEPARRPRSKQLTPTFPPALLSFAPLSHYIGFGRSRIYALISQGEFPPPLKIGKSSRWVRSEIDQWLSDQVSARNSLSAGQAAMTSKNMHGAKPGTATPKNKAPALGNAEAQSKSETQSDFKSKPLDFGSPELMLLWVSHDHDCPGAVGKVSQCKCNPTVERVHLQEFAHRVRMEAKHGL